MSKYCVVRTCKARAALTVITGEKITIHKFPQEEYLRQKWELFVNYANRTTDFRSKNHCVCSRHFDPSCYFFGRLRNNAVPTIADEFTPEIALRYQLIPHLYSKDLDMLNDYSNTFIKLRNCETSDSILRARLSMSCDTVMKNSTNNACVTTDHFNKSKDVKATTKVFNHVQSGAVAVPSGNLKKPEDVHSETVYVESGCFGVERVKTEVIHENDIEQSDITTPISDTSSVLESSSDKRCFHNSRLRRRMKRTAYCGDLSPSDFSSPRRCELNLVKFKTELSTTRKHLRVTNQKIKRADQSIITLQSLLSKLNKQTSLSEEDIRVLRSYGITTKLRKESAVGDLNDLSASDEKGLT